MNLSQHLAPQVSSGSRSRGASYFRRGAVQQIEEVAGGIEATVIGSMPYPVRLEPKGHRLLVTCACPFFLDRIEPCKHVWAALLAAEARSLRVTAPGIKPGSVVIDAVEVDDGVEDDDDPDNEADLNFGEGPEPRSNVRFADHGRRYRAAAGQPFRSPPPTPPRPTPWQQLFGRLTSEPDPTSRDSRPPPTWC